MRTGWRLWLVVVLMLGVMWAEMAGSVRRESLSWDEGDHLFAGYLSLKTGDLGLNPEHPPMAKMVAALPLLALPLHMPQLQGRWFKDEAYFDGQQLLFHNAPYSADMLLFRARMAMTVFPLLLALLVFLAGSEMFGTSAGLIAMALVVLEPNLLTHGPFVTTDSALTCMFFGTIWLLYRFVRVAAAGKPGIGRLLAAGGIAGLALAAKHSAVVLLPVVVLLLSGEVVARWWRLRKQRRSAESAGSYALRLSGSLVALTVVAVLVLWVFYGFRYQARPGALRLSPSLAEYVVPLRPIEAKGILLMARLHVLPESWLYGLADVRSMANAMPSYLFGKVYAHGVWMYFPSALAIKLTLGSIGLVLLAIWATATGKVRKPREVWFLLVPAAVYLWVAMGSQLNIGIRHVLPILPFLLVFAAGGVVALVKEDKRWAWVAGVLLVAHGVSSARAYPNYLPYANEAWGGPTQTYRYLTDSSTDWGQQLHQVSNYLRRNNIHECWFAYFVSPYIAPADYGIPCRMLPTADTVFVGKDYPAPAVISGVIVMSSADVNGYEFGTKVRNPYESFMGLKPDAVIDDGIFVYHGTYTVPLAAAIEPTLRSTRLLKRGDVAGAVDEAKNAVQVAPMSFDAQMQLGKAEARAGQSADARAAFENALALVATMEPSAQELWRPQVEEALRGVK